MQKPLNPLHHIAVLLAMALTALTVGMLFGPTKKVTTVGTVEPEMHSGGKLHLVGKGYGTLPMWVLNYPNSTNPMWGYVKVKHIGQVEYLKEELGYNLVHSGNFLDPEYATTFPALYDGREKVWHIPSRRGSTENEPADYMVVVWLDKGRYPSAPGHSAEN